MPVKNVCDCDNPPGGQVACEPYQMAVCGVINGVVRRECLNPPSASGGSPTVLVNWALSQVSGEYRTADSRVTAVDLLTLNKGEFTSSSGGVVNFVIPEDMANIVRILMSERKSSNTRSSTMDMPKLIPIPIHTKGKTIWMRIWSWITSIRKWELVEDWEYQLPDGEPIILIPKGFVFDGASIPRPLWGLLSPTGLLLIPGLIHDFAYRYDYLWAIDSAGVAYKYKEKSGQWIWDSMFRKVGLEVNGITIIGTLAWFVLATSGWWAWRSNRKRNEPAIKPNG